jgi:DNA polymerase III delta prime subunit
MIYDILKSICDKEQIKHNEIDLKQLARQAGGDLRAAVNDLQTISYSKEVRKEDILELSQSNKQESMPQALVKIFKSYGWEWGGDWKFTDMPHFQKTYGLSIKQLQFKTKNLGGSNFLI